MTVRKAVSESLLMDIDRHYLWHPYTQMKDFEQEDFLFIDHGDGVFLFDPSGMRYYDTISSWWCMVHGHNHPRIKEAVRQQLDRLEHVHFAGTTHEGAVRVAKELVRITPDKLQRVFYSDNGSTACEVAVKMSFQYWKHAGEPQREMFVSLERGYHGDTIGMLGLGGVPGFQGPFDALTFDSFRIPSPYCCRCAHRGGPGMGSDSPGAGICALECLDPLERLLDERGDEVAGIILEPLLQGAGGMIVYPVEYLARLGDLTARYGTHLIFDEVATGFGRTGKMFALEHSNIVPDFLCLSKGLTAGYLPMAATLTTEDIYQAFYADYSEGKTFFHGHTFTANPLSCAAALASLEIFEQEEVVERLEEKVEVLQQGTGRFLDLELVGDVRGIGMVAAFELVQDSESMTPFPPEIRAGWQVYREGLKNGLILRPLGDVVYILPPLSITVDQMEDVLDRTYEILSGIRIK
ncbi:MAG TPA: adenosylmethionine--8-amino-7-oxononanoate transaminase [Thermodesulfobacteriaceae bacterium]|nr:adenosylmethionine--8-amino-7-oxononanoate transaminase [Thermodesulfobacteriaceae bacterium]